MDQFHPLANCCYWLDNVVCILLLRTIFHFGHSFMLSWYGRNAGRISWHVSGISFEMVPFIVNL